MSSEPMSPHGSIPTEFVPSVPVPRHRTELGRAPMNSDAFPLPGEARSPGIEPGTRGRIMVVDDHPVVRHGLKELLSHEPDLEICGEAEGAEDALRLVGPLAPDLIIVDILLKGTNGIDLVKRLRALYPGIRILVASMHDESFLAERALRAGAMGYVCKQEPVERMLEAIRSLLRGGVYLSPDMTARVVQATMPRGRGDNSSAVSRLSDRELEVFEAIGHGRSTRLIAESLNLSVKTVETHREKVKRKLGLKNSTELVQRAWQWVLMGD